MILETHQIRRSYQVKKIVFFILLCAAASPLALLHSEEVSRSKNFRLSQQTAAPGLTLPPAAAQVNGTVISTELLWNTLLAKAGSAVLNNLVDEALIEQAAGKKFGSKSAQAKIDKEIDAKIADLKKQFPDEKVFQEQLRSAGVRPEDLRRQIRMQIYRERLLKGKAKVSKEKVTKFFNENKQRFAAPPNEPVLTPEIQKSIESYLLQSKLEQEYAKLIKDLRDKAKIQIFLNN
ncbi:MAG: hypothetical protein A2901_06890 [Elusimicrobia bacterium RIFCSPLOWO2_01_FULL_54_10]|nr:MAG: hypothetical protein A2901_06890 [Elusimicrobia bacterium RIFCSPLOWO2_01_FULL_54_10]